MLYSKELRHELGIFFELTANFIRLFENWQEWQTDQQLKGKAINSIKRLNMSDVLQLFYDLDGEGRQQSIGYRYIVNDTINRLFPEGKVNHMDEPTYSSPM